MNVNTRKLTAPVVIREARSNEERGQLKRGFIKTPDINLAQAILHRTKRESGFIPSAMSVLQITDSTATGQILPRPYLEAYSKLQAQITTRLKDMRAIKHGGHLVPLTINNIKWPLRTEELTLLQREAIDTLENQAVQLIDTVAKDFGSRKILIIKNCQFNGREINGCIAHDKESVKSSSKRQEKIKEFLFPSAASEKAS